MLFDMMSDKKNLCSIAPDARLGKSGRVPMVGPLRNPTRLNRKCTAEQRANLASIGAISYHQPNVSAGITAFASSAAAESRPTPVMSGTRCGRVIS